MSVFVAVLLGMAAGSFVAGFAKAMYRDRHPFTIELRAYPGGTEKDPEPKVVVAYGEPIGRAERLVLRAAVERGARISVALAKTRGAWRFGDPLPGREEER